jgi:hypothetical protein
VQFISKDAAGNLSAAQQNNFATGTVPAGTSFQDALFYSFAITNDVTDLCNDPDEDECTADGVNSVDLTAVVTGSNDPTLSNPFASGTVYFYYSPDGVNYELIGKVSAATVGVDLGGNRTYTWTLADAVTSEDVLDWPDMTVYPVYAIGVNDDGDALMTNANTNITIYE